MRLNERHAVVAWIAGSLDRSCWDRGRCGREMDMDGGLSACLSSMSVPNPGEYLGAPAGWSPRLNATLI